MRVPLAEYDDAYFGHGDKPPKANYRCYGPPPWAPLVALLIKTWGLGPVLDVGGAFGYLTAALRGVGVQAFNLDCSQFAYDNRACAHFIHDDALTMSKVPDNFYQTIVSMDLLEHFEPDDTEKVMDSMIRVARTGAVMFHLVGFPRPDLGDQDNHYDDPTHLNHEPLQWYIDRFEERGWTIYHKPMQEFNKAFQGTDWSGRWIALAEVSR